MRQTASILIVLLSLGLASLCGDETEAEKKGREIMRKNYKQATTKNFRSDVIMKLIDRRGRTQTRHLKRISKTDDKDQERYLLIFTQPPDYRGTALLTIEHTGRDDDTWLYLPAIRKIRQMAGANLRNSYVGSEFSYKDLKREKVKPGINRYVLVKHEAVGGVDHYVIDAFAVSSKEKAEQGYKRRRIWVRSDNHLASRIDFYDKDGDFLKRLTAKDMRDVGKSGKTRYYEITMTNRKGVKTVLTFQMIRINEQPPDDKFFTRGYLMRKH
jgi:hypothetical protein